MEFDRPYEGGHRELDNKHPVVEEVCFQALLAVVVGEVGRERRTRQRYRQGSPDHVLLEPVDAPADEDRLHERERMLALVRTRV